MTQAIEVEWFYDNLTDAVAPEGMVAVERVYCLDFNTFGEPEWHQLSAICNSLPFRQPDSDDGCPWWFGSDESNPPFLWASVEPSGWLVHGVVRPYDWRAWDAQLQSAVAELPKFACG